VKTEQLVGSGASSQNAFVGAPRQVTVDTDNWDLRVHDGSTPGGHRLVNRDNGDERWQPRSPELNGFSFAPESRGFLSRTGAGEYRIRRFTFNADNFQIEFPDGYEGDPKFGLPTQIKSDHRFLGDIIIDGVLEVGGGVNADTSGHHHGDVTGNVEGNLTGNTAGTHTGPSVGDVDVRGHTIQFDDGQIQPEAINGLTDLIKTHAVPMGVILMWSGLEVDIPTGWLLCDGLNGTPDLRDKFVMGAGTGGVQEPGNTGGIENHAHGNTIEPGGSHTHPITINGHALTERSYCDKLSVARAI